MTLSKWFRSSAARTRRRKSKDRRMSYRPQLEALEVRSVLSTFFVANINDSGPGSLRQAVADANDNPGADTIKFKGPAHGTITLASELDITGDTTIKGPGADNLTVSGGGTTRVFKIEAGANVTIEKLTIANAGGSPSPNDGILNQGTLTLQKSVVTGNAGMGVNNSHGTLTIIDSQVSNNGVRGIYSRGGPLTVLDSVISKNHVGGISSMTGTTIRNTQVIDNGYDGNYFSTSAGIVLGEFPDVSGPIATLDQVVVSRNHGGSVGGIYLTAENPAEGVIITNSVISDNVGDQGPIFGSTGGVMSVFANLTIRDSVISGNSGRSAGGIHVYGANSQSQLTISRSTISGNSADPNFLFFYEYPMSFGGLVSSASAQIEDSSIRDNLGGQVGGAMFLDRVNLVRSTVSGNRAQPTPAPYFPTVPVAGGVLVLNPFFSQGGGAIDNSTISGNTVIGDQLSDLAPTAGGLVLDGHDAPSIDHSTIAFNSVANAPAGSLVAGGVLETDTGGVSVRNTIIAKNSANLGDQDVRGAFASGGHNLIGILNSDATGFVPSDLRGSDALPLDPRLKPLGWYGGLTQTHALMRNSPALNAGDNTNAPSTDQRGRHRIMGDTIDIGSYEAAFGGGDTDHSQADNWWQPSSSATIDAIVGVGSTGSSPTGGANVSSSSNPVTQRASQRVDAGTRPSGGLQSLFEGDDEWLIGRKLASKKIG